MTCLDQEYLAKPDRLSEHLLRWHYRRAVLASMKGAGELILEHDFSPGSEPAEGSGACGIRTVWTIVSIHKRIYYFP